MQTQTLLTDQQWSDAIAIRNKVIWFSPISVAQSQSFFQDSLLSGVAERSIVYKDSLPVAYYGITNHSSTATANAYTAFASIDPELPAIAEVAEYCVNAILVRLKELNYSQVDWELHDSAQVVIKQLEKTGFEQVARFPVSMLDLEDLSFDKSCDIDGLEVINYIEYAKREPENWKEIVWRLEMDVCQDLPLTFPFKETPFELFCAELSGSSVDLNFLFIGLINGKPAGITHVRPSKSDSRFIQHGMTGVRREYRRMRLATAMKQNVSLIAKKLGALKIFTENEENNPMFLVNQQLGYQHVFDELTFRKINTS
jgi:hypothetical protein